LQIAAHDNKMHETVEAPASQVDTGVKVKLLDLELVDKDGKPVRFETEAVADHIVAVDFIYTSCTTICPVLSSIMAQVEDQLDGRLGEEIRLISISTDPNRDTPRRLSEYAGKFGAGPDWIWLTGRKPDVDRVLTALGAYSIDFVDHPPMVVIGDPKSGNWSRLIGLPDPEDIALRLEELAAARQVSNAALTTEE
ncbi:MAG TPA: SCO family protein, partial [Geminicoccaceae bacterium]|nr:SCO family protein [Geminicoccaceae bacterium]